jgi:3',5'-cyclic-AMP phosphodiesterase
MDTSTPDWLTIVMRRVFFAVTAACVCFSAFAQPSAKPLARIALLSDPHVNRATNGNEANFKEHFEKTIAAVNNEQVDCVLITGDLTQDGKTEEMSDFKAHIQKFKPPVWFVAGNHDVGHKFNSGKNEGTITPQRMAHFEKELGPAFFATNVSGLYLVGITSSLLGSGLEREQQQWRFLEQEFSKPSGVPKLIFMHYPLFIAEPDEAGGVYFNIEPEPRKRLLSLLKSANVKTVLSGHLHRRLINTTDGVLFLSTPPISFGLPRGKEPEAWTLVTVSENGTAQYEFRRIE